MAKKTVKRKSEKISTSTAAKETTAQKSALQSEKSDSHKVDTHKVLWWPTRVWISLLIVFNIAGIAMIALDATSEKPQIDLALSGAFFALGVFDTLFLMSLFRLNKVGFIGTIICSVISLVLNLYMGMGLLSGILIALIPNVVLLILLRKDWHNLS
ncbi:MAG TPA: hypothetical protein VK158_02205 [Acidobacteriota bacterium]|nr:hypothetical protein [Acidobacteriota bacterium]